MDNTNMEIEQPKNNTPSPAKKTILIIAAVSVLLVAAIVLSVAFISDPSYNLQQGTSANRTRRIRQGLRAAQQESHI